MSAANRGGKRDVLDRYYTPDALALACLRTVPELLEEMDRLGPAFNCLEPSVGGGAWVRAVRQICPEASVYGIDLDPDAPGLRECSASMGGLDFLDVPAPWPESPRWIIGNPPYRNCEEHIRHAIAISARNVLFLLRLSMLESSKRRDLWQRYPPRQVWVIQQRPSFTGGGTDSSAYGLFWWDALYIGKPSLGWISWR